MSNTDTKVVEMQFQNSQFERNASQSLDTLGKLAEAASMKDAVSGFSNLDKAAKGIDFSGLASSIQDIQKHFSTVGIIADEVLRTIANKATQYGMQILNSAIINPIKSLSDMEMASQGWDKYNKKVQAVQTIMKATGEDIDSVSYKLQDLANYTDKTSYSYSQMVDNIGKFTANGVELGDAIKAIEGVANVAALSGVGASDPAAARAMYNFSQALASGSVKAIDWKSIENANMATKTFKEQIIDTAKALGTLDAEGKTLKGTTVTYQNFRETLQEGWFSSDVLIATLKEFADAESEIGKKAYAAAAEAKTFQDALGAMQDAFSSSWSTTFEYIFGNYEEATKVWTGIQDAVIDFLAPRNERRNNLLEGALLDPYKQFINLIGEAGVDADKFESAFDDILLKEGINVEETIERLGITRTEYLQRLSKDMAGYGLDASRGFTSYLTEAVKKAGGATGDLTQKTEEYKNLLDEIMNGNWGQGAERFAKLTEAGYDEDFVQSLVNKSAMGETIDWAEELKDKVDSVGVSYVELNNIAEEAGTTFADSLSMVGEAGGFYLFWDGVRELFLSFTDVVNTIGDAFRDIFPPLTAKRLYEFLDRFNTFAHNLRPNEATLDKISRTFKGLFDIFKVGGELLGAVVKGIVGFIKTLNFGEKGLLDYTSSIGDTLKAFAEWIRENETIKKVSEGITKGLTKLYTGIGDTITKAKEKVAPLIESLKNLGKAIKAIFEPLFKKKDDEDLLPLDEGEVKKKTTVLEVLKNILSGIVNFFINFTTIMANIGAKILNFINPIIQAVGEAAKSLWEGIKEAFTTESGNIDISKILTTALAGGVGIGIIDLIKTLKDRFTAKGGLVDSIKEIFSSISDLVGKFKGGGGEKTFVDDLKEVAKSLLILAAAIFIISTIDPASLALSVIAMGVLLEALSQFMIKLGALGTIKMVSLTAVTKSLTKVAASILILAVAMKIIGSMKIEQIIASMAAIVILLAMVTVVMQRIGKIEGLSKNTAKGAKSLIFVATAILTLTKAVKNLADLNLAQLAKGVGAVYLLMAALAGFIEDTNKKGMSLGNALGVIAIVAAVLLLTNAVKDLGTMDLGELVKGLGSVVILLGVLAAFVKNTTGAEGMMKTGLALIELGLALSIVTNVIQKLGAMSLGSLAQGIIGMAAATGILVGALALLSSIDATHLLGAAAAILVLSAAMLVLTPAIMAFASLTWEELGIAILALAGIFVIFATAGLLLAPIAPMILTLAAAMALMGVSVLAFGVGLLALSAAVTAFAASSALIPATMTALALGLLLIIPTIIEAIGQIVVSIINLFGEILPAIIELLTEIIVAVCTAIIEAAPAIIEALKTIALGIISLVSEVLSAILDAIIEITPKFLEAVKLIVLGILEIVKEVVLAVIDLVKETIIAICNATVEAIPAVLDVLCALCDAAIEFIRTYVPILIDLGLELLVSLIQGIADNIKDILEAGKNVIVNFLEGIGEMIPDIVNAGFDMIESIIEGLNQAIKEKGPDIIAGGLELASTLISSIVSGIGQGATRIWNSVTDAVEGAWQTAKSWLGIDSPSKKFMELGEYSSIGFAEGMDNIDVEDSGKELAKKVEDGAIEGLEEFKENVQDPMQKIFEAVESNLDSTPVIAPVLDLSNVSTGINDISSMFGGVSNLGLSASGTFDMASISSQVGLSPDGFDISSALGDTSSITNQTNSFTNTFNITGDDPTAIADEVSKILSQQTQREATVWA